MSSLGFIIVAVTDAGTPWLSQPWRRSDGARWRRRSARHQAHDPTGVCVVQLLSRAFARIPVKHTDQGCVLQTCWIGKPFCADPPQTGLAQTFLWADLTLSLSLVLLCQWGAISDVITWCGGAVGCASASAFQRYPGS